MERSAGIAIIYRDQILMSHATNAPWFKSWMPPKGKLEEGETEEEDDTKTGGNHLAVNGLGGGKGER